jgi:hypothetical protein
MDKIEVIESSLRCFTMGLIGLLPALGVPFAIVAVSNFLRVKRLVGPHWNPAQTYLTWGLATALAGLFLTVVLAFVVAIIIVEELASA